MSDKDIKDANIPDVVDTNKIKNSLAENHIVSIISKEGKALLDKTNKPNVITYAQFEPFIPIFKIDQERYNTDPEYNLYIRKLCVKYKQDLEINFYQPTLVVDNEESKKVLYYLDRVWTRFNAGDSTKPSNREQLPQHINRAAGETRDMMLLNASLKDIGDANSTEESLKYFRSVRNMSAIITKNFVENNLSPELKEKIVPQNVVDAVSNVSFEIDDEE